MCYHNVYFCISELRHKCAKTTPTIEWDRKKRILVKSSVGQIVPRSVVLKPTRFQVQYCYKDANLDAKSWYLAVYLQTKGSIYTREDLINLELHIRYAHAQSSSPFEVDRIFLAD